MLNRNLTLDQLLKGAIEHHQSGRLQQAEAMYREILRHDPGCADALHLLGVLASQVGRHEIAVDLIRQAIALNPDLAAAHNNLGNVLRMMGRFDEAVAASRAAITLKPDSPQAHFNLGNTLKDQGRIDEAIEAYRQAAVLGPRLHEVHNNLGNALRDMGRLDEAVAAFRQAIALKGDSPEVHTNLGRALHEQGNVDEAVAAYRRAVALKPGYAEAHNHLGNSLREKGLLDEAIAAYRRSIALKGDFAGPHYNLGIALYERGRLDEAIAACRAAIALQGDFPEAYNNLGNALHERRQVEEAIAAYRQAIALKGDYPGAYNNLAKALSDRGRLDEAIIACRQGIALQPNFPQAYNNLGNVLKDKGQLDDAITAFRQAIALKPSLIEAHNNLVYALHFHPGYDARQIAAELSCWNRQHAEPRRKFIQGHSNDRNPERRLRIGYVSPDFREHPIGRFLLPLLSHHDKREVEIFAYSLRAASDSMTERLRSCADVWQSLVGLSDTRAGDLIRQDQIDILVDLTMHMDHGRLLIFALKPAPVQVTYLAYCSSTGMQAMDYRLSDPYLDPPGVDETQYSEQTIRLAETYWCYQPPAAPSASDGPALSMGFITFGCLNNFCKVNESVLAAWAKILLATENSQLLLHAHEGDHRRLVGERMERMGIDRGRVRFAGVAAMLDYLRLYEEIDIALDPFPYGGGTTTCDALWMGVPVVSLHGETAVGRGGFSILSNVGLPELVARSQEEYVQIASELAGDLPRLRAMRSTLRARMERTSLMDAPRFAGNVEDAYRRMWREWCARSTAPA